MTPTGSVLPFELVSRPCPVCGATESGPFAPANVDPGALGAFAFASRKLPEYMHFALVTCPTCDLLYTNPAPAPGALEGLYRDAAFDAAEESRHASVTYGRQLDQFVGRLPDRDGALDIGTGDGTFLAELIARGFTSVAGVEPSSAPVAMASSAVRPLIRNTIFQAGDFTPASMSLVTCFQTIEHVPDPLALCREARALLKPGGAIFLVCHNRRALLARLMGLKSPIFDVEHLQLFSPSSVRGLLERAGFLPGTIEIRPLVNRYPLDYWGRLFPLPKAAKLAALGLLRKSGWGASRWPHRSGTWWQSRSRKPASFDRARGPSPP
jgi:SAM-dependent methyltransferase